MWPPEEEDLDKKPSLEEDPEEERDHDGDAGGGVGKKPPGLLDKGHLSVG